MLSMSQEIIQEKKDMLEAHWSTILAVLQLQLQLDTARPRTRGLCAGTGGGGVC